MYAIGSKIDAAEIVSRVFGDFMKKQGILLLVICFISMLWSAKIPNVVVFDPEHLPGTMQTAAIVQNELHRALAETGKFRVVERRNLDAIMKEQQLSMEDFTEQSSIYRLGQLLDADYILFSSLHQQNSQLLVYLNLTDVFTGETLYPESFISTTDIRTIKREVDTAVERIGSRFELRGTIVKMDGDDIFIDLGIRNNLSKDNILEVYRTGDRIIDPSAFRVIGFDRKRIGEIIITEAISEELSRARLYSGEKFAVGDEITLKAEEPGSFEIKTSNKVLPPKVKTHRDTYLEIRVKPGDANVFLDTKQLRNRDIEQPYRKRIEPGIHFVRMEKKGYGTLRKSLEVREGEQFNLEVTLQPEMGTLYLNTEPTGAEVYLDGQYEGISPIRICRDRSDRYRLRLVKSGYKNEERSVRLRPGDISDLLITLDSDPKTHTIMPPAMELIPGGTFIMGSEEEEAKRDEQPQHRVEIESFYIDRYEVMVKQFRTFCEVTGYRMPELPDWISDHDPMINVTWYDAKAYAQWASKRLPTEAEWEYVARNSCPQSAYCKSQKKLDPRNWANIQGNSGNDHWEKVAPVGSFQPDSAGLYDLGGNVFEWCEDWYDRNYYSYSVSKNPQGAGFGNRKVIRGGCWAFGTEILHAWSRSVGNPNTRSSIIGFRCAMSIGKDRE